jgi:hypothetical protein
VNPELAEILYEARTLIARGHDLDAEAFEERARTTAGADGVAQLRRLFAVARAKKRSHTAPPTGPKPQGRASVYRARPTIAATMTVRACAAGEGVALEWEPRAEVVRWEARLAERPDLRAPYVDRDTVTLEGPRFELRLGDRPKRISIIGRAASGRVVRHALISGLTSSNWRQQWQRRPTAS